MSLEWVKVEATDKSFVIGVATIIAFLALIALLCRLSLVGEHTMFGILLLVAIVSVVPISKTNMGRRNTQHAICSLILIGGMILITFIGLELGWRGVTWGW